MLNLDNIRSSENQIFVLGNHEAIIQSILDFDYLSKKQKGSVVGIFTGKSGFAKYFFGREEILIPTFVSIDAFINYFKSQKSNVNVWFLNLLSGRRTLTSSKELIKSNLFTGGSLFAEGVPELHSLLLSGSGIPLIGPASVGLIIPRVIKLGAIGGITPLQIEESHLTTSGSLAIFSASGGMTNELISLATSSGHNLSFALSFGGDRFPVFSPLDAFILAESDQATKAVLYYGELGGEDEYALIELIKQGKFTKPVIAHIAGTVASLFPESPQFGHAKAKADNQKVTAQAKRQELKKVGVKVSDSFADFVQLVKDLTY